MVELDCECSALEEEGQVALTYGNRAEATTDRAIHDKSLLLSGSTPSSGQPP